MDEFETTNESSLLFEQEHLLEPATKGQRFANYVIDIVFIYIVLCVFAIVMEILFLSTTRLQIINQEPTTYNGNRDSLLQFFFLFIFSISIVIIYTLLEGSLKGKTIGKYITKTRVVKLNGSKITWKDAFLRSLSRIVPFEVFSGLGDNVWHDSWTNTMVVKEKSLLKP